MRSIPLGNGKHFFAFCRYTFVLLSIESTAFIYLFLTQKNIKNFNFISYFGPNFLLVNERKKFKLQNDLIVMVFQLDKILFLLLQYGSMNFSQEGFLLLLLKSFIHISLPLKVYKH